MAADAGDIEEQHRPSLDRPNLERGATPDTGDTRCAGEEKIVAAPRTPGEAAEPPVPRRGERSLTSADYRRGRRPASPPTRPPPGLQRQRSKAAEALEVGGEGRAGLVAEVAASRARAGEGAESWVKPAERAASWANRRLVPPHDLESIL
jgi:hypothetical protein